MIRGALAGTIAGCLGTIALNISTYADMAIRARSSSSAPSQLVARLADTLCIALSPQGNGSSSQEAQNRESGLGALFGYVNGLGIGTLYGSLRPQLKGLPTPLAGIVVGVAAMAASDVPLAMLRVSNPTSWSLSDWASDAIPHLIYGLVTAVSYEALESSCSR